MAPTLNKTRRTAGGLRTKAQAKSGGGSQSKSRKVTLTPAQRREKDKSTRDSRKRNAQGSPVEREIRKMSRNSRRSRG